MNLTEDLFRILKKKKTVIQTLPTCYTKKTSITNYRDLALLEDYVKNTTRKNTLIYNLWY